MAIDTRFCLKCALVNIQSVGNKTCKIRDYTNDNKLDILMLAETWLNNYDSAKIREMTPDTQGSGSRKRYRHPRRQQVRIRYPHFR